MFPRRSHVFGLLTDLIGTSPFVWLPIHQQAFEEKKALLVAYTLMRGPDHNIPFHIFIDASDYQLGSVIMQNDLPVAYYSRKLSAAQKNYTTIEKESLSVVETFKEFRSMLLGAVLHVHTDHRNLI
jgi:hypothetical protein